MPNIYRLIQHVLADILNHGLYICSLSTSFTTITKNVYKRERQAKKAEIGIMLYPILGFQVTYYGKFKSVIMRQIYILYLIEDLISDLKYD